MRHFLWLFALLTCLAASAQTATSAGTKFGPLWRVLEGEWQSEPAGRTGPGLCAFRLALGGHILVRTNHTELPGAGHGLAMAHDDLMVIRPGPSETTAAASYWDNEGHVIEYAATWSDDGNTLTFVSQPGPGPQFRLVYKKVDADTWGVSFEMAPPGQAGAFTPYTSGRMRRQKPGIDRGRVLRERSRFS